MGSLPVQIPSALVVDDNEDNCELFRVALNIAGYEVTTAVNGIEALAILEDRTFDLMILDLQMPKLDGGSVLRILRANPRYASMAITVATANPHMAHSEIDALADYVVYKPYELRPFILLVERLKEKAHSLGLDHSNEPQTNANA